MRKLALSDEILLSVDKAARYIGGEVNSIMKDKDKVTTRVAFSFPDVYEIGMSNLGMMLLILCSINALMSGVSEFIPHGLILISL